MGDARGVAGDVVDAADDGVGAFEGGGVGQLDHGDHVAHVLRRDETDGDLAEEPSAKDGEAGVDDENQQGDAGEAADEAGVGRRSPFERLVEDAEEPSEHGVEGAGEEVVALVVRAEEQAPRAGER